MKMSLKLIIYYMIIYLRNIELKGSLNPYEAYINIIHFRHYELYTLIYQSYTW